MTKADVFLIVTNIYTAQLLRNNPLQLFVGATLYVILYCIHSF